MKRRRYDEEDLSRGEADTDDIVAVLCGVFKPFVFTWREFDVRRGTHVSARGGARPDRVARECYFRIG